MNEIFDRRDLQLLIAGILLIGIGWFLVGSPRVGGILMLFGAGLMLVAQFRMLRAARRRS